MPAVTRRALVMAGGDFSPATLAGLALGDAAVVCVDRGLVHAQAAGLVPSLLIGDLDSVPADLLARFGTDELPRRLFPADKDASDLELALRILADGPEVPDEVVVVGVSGGRTDHLLFNWLLPARCAWPFSLRLVDATVEATVVTPRRPFAATAVVGRTVSLLPLEHARGVTTRGLRYALTDATLAPGSTLGLSNVVGAPGIRVEVAAGIVLALVARADDTSSSLPESPR